MKLQDSYFVELASGAKAWLAAGKAAPADAKIIEVRPMIIPDFGKVLRHKDTGAESSGHWLRGDDSADKWEEIEEPKEVE